MADSDDLQALFDAGGEVQLEPRRYELERPLIIRPERGLSVTGRGMGVSELWLLGEGASVIEGLRDRPAGAVTLKDFSVHPGTSSRAGAGITLTAPRLFTAWRGHTAEFVAERVEVLGSGYASFARGFDVNNLTGPKIDKCWVSGRFSDVTSQALADPGAMECAFYLGGAQEAKLTNSYAACAREGVRSTVPTAGCGEGVEISGNALICINETIVLWGERPGVHGGWATPWNVVRNNHLFYLRKAIFAVNRSDLILDGNSLCGSHLNNPNETLFAVHLAACQNTRIFGNSVWSPSFSNKSRGYAFIIDGCQRGTFFGNVVDPSVHEAVRFAEVNGKNPGWSAAGNVWGLPRGIIGPNDQPMTLAA